VLGVQFAQSDGTESDDSVKNATKERWVSALAVSLA
jgi:hypothetical protein